MQYVQLYDCAIVQLYDCAIVQLYDCAKVQLYDMLVCLELTADYFESLNFFLFETMNNFVNLWSLISDQLTLKKTVVVITSGLLFLSVEKGDGMPDS